MARHRLPWMVAVAAVAGMPFALENEGGAQSSSVVLVGAGDVTTDCEAGASIANAEATATLLDGIPGSVFTTGDNSNADGSYGTFITCYDPTWGRSKARTRPAAGNHDYATANASGYFDYFNGAGVQTGQAGDRGKGYYSYDVGSWHVVVLNSECGPAGLWDVNGCAVGSPQEQWLRADLAASPTNNIVAMFHKPRYSSGWKERAVQPLWQALYEYGADLVLSSHVHNYERLAPAGPTGARDATYGIRQFVVGTGGASHQAASSNPIAISELNDGSSYGVIKLTLSDSSFAWQFVHVPGATLSDGGTGIVHARPPHGIVASWQMEEGGGTALVDSSSFNNGAATTGSPAWVTGYSGLALGLNGSTYAIAPDAGLLNPNTLTLAAWVNPAQVATQYLLKKTGAWELGLASNGVPFFRLNNSLTYRINATAPQANGSWMHLAGTFDGSTMHFYVDGVEQGTGIAGPAVINAVTAPVGIGAQSDGTSRFKGLLDDVRVYNKALSATDIQALAGGGNFPPVVNAGPDETIAFGTAASLNGTITDDGLPNPPGAVTTTWSKVSGPGTVAFGNVSSAVTTATFSAAGVYTLQLSASDGALTSGDQVVISVNQPPAGNAGPDQSIPYGAAARLAGTVTDDGLPNPPGTVTVTWSQMSGPGTTTFANPSSASTSATFSASGTYTLQLTASDGVLTSSDTLLVTVAASPTPAGYWKQDEGGGTVLVDSSGLGNNGTIFQTPTWITGTSGLAIRWGAIAYATVPSTASLDLTGAMTIAAWIRPETTRRIVQCLIKKGTSTGGGYELGLSKQGKVYVRLNNNDTYRVNSSSSYPTDGTWMHVAATYDGVTIRLYVNGVPQGSVAGPTSITSTTTAVAIGAQSDATSNYLGATDEARIYGGALSASDVQAIMTRTTTNQAPGVNAGPDQTIAYGGTATLSGTTNDDGLPNPPGALTITWSQLSGPGTATFANAQSASTTATFSVHGTYALQLAAYDGALTSTDTVSVTMNAQTTTNQAPVVNAGPDQTIAYGGTATLSGTATDDGLPNPPGALTVTWGQVSGPGTTTFANTSSASTTATFSTAGTYSLQLSAYDGALTSTDPVTITVSASPSTATLVGYYKADEGGGTVLGDSSGLANNGTINLTPTWITGHTGLAIRFGASAYVAVPSSTSLNITGPVTIAAWVRAAATSTAYTQVLVKKGSSATGAYELGLSSTGHAYMRLNNSSTYRLEGATSYPTDGTWIHVAAAYDGTTIRLYVNGVLDGSLAGPSGIASNALALGIGATADAIGKYKGAIDEVRIYSGALSASEIQTLASQ